LREQLHFSLLAVKVAAVPSVPGVYYDDLPRAVIPNQGVPCPWDDILP